jgi:hypothetical protein
MDPRRRLRTTACAVGALLALTACEKPTPLVTVVSGGASVYTEASTWCFEDQDPPECSEHEPGTPSLSVRGGETIGIDVDKELAEEGWQIALALASAPEEADQPWGEQDGHYFSFELPANIPTDSALLLTVLIPGGEGEEPRGLWQFRLEVED